MNYLLLLCSYIVLATCTATLTSPFQSVIYIAIATYDLYMCLKSCTSNEMGQQLAT